MKDEMSSTTDSATLLSDKNWRRRNSLWLLWVIAGIGMFSFIGFLVVANRIRTRRWWIIALSVSVVTVLVWTVNVLTEDPTTGELSDTAGAITMVAWFGMIAAGTYLNREYLRWKSSGQSVKSWYQEPLVSADPTVLSAPPTGENPAPVFGIEASDYYSAVPSSAPVGRTTVDLNSATEAELQSAMNLSPAVTSRIVAAREQQGVYQDVDDLARRVDLQPHEFVRIRDRAVFEGAAPPEGNGPTRPGGRILDF